MEPFGCQSLPSPGRSRKKTCKNSAKHGHPRGDSVGERLFTLQNCQDSGKGLSYYERPRQGKGDTWLMVFCNKKTIRCSTMPQDFATNAGKYPYCGRGGHPCTSARHPAAVHIRILNERSLGFWKNPEAIWSGKSTCSRLS